METLLIVPAVILGLCALGWINYLLMSRPKKVFFKQQLKSLPHMVARYFV